MIFGKISISEVSSRLESDRVLVEEKADLLAILGMTLDDGH